ncbi:hypothetical protein, partial [Mycobacterium tuberculosis]
VGAQATGGSLVPCVATVKSIAPVNTQACVIRNNGLAPAPDTVSALNLKSTYQDEYIIGYEHRIDALWKVGVNLTYR